MAKKPQTPAKKSQKSVPPADDLTTTTDGGIELTEDELSRASGGFSVTQNPIVFNQPLDEKIF